jgi:DNA modification methylase
MRELDELLRGAKNYAIITGDAFEVLKQIPNNSISCVITSPPYWQLREYENSENPNSIGKETDYVQYVQKLTNLFCEVKRVLTDTGSLWLNLGDKYCNKELMGIPWRVAISLIDSGWILRNDVIWD